MNCGTVMPVDNSAESLSQAIRLMEEHKDLEVDECLVTFSEAEATEIEPLLWAIDSIDKLGKSAPKPAGKATNKRMFISLVGKHELMDEPFYNYLKTPLFKIAAAISVVLVLTVSVVTAAWSSQPTNRLYPVKRLIENTGLLLPRSDYSLAKLRLSLVKKRLKEMEAVAVGNGKILRYLNGEIASELNKTKRSVAGLSSIERQEIIKDLGDIYGRHEKVTRRLRGGGEKSLYNLDDDDDDDGDNFNDDNDDEEKGSVLSLEEEERFEKLEDKL